MGSDSKIEWTDATFNPWWGCVKVSPACTHCYAATLANRYGTEWGPNARRRFFGDKHWQEPVKWNRKAEREGRRMKVFCASMADVFEELPADHPDREQMAAERIRLFDLIDATPHLDWLLLTKRPENIGRMWAPGQMRNHPHRHNCWLGCTVEDQANADRRIPELLKCRDLSPVLFLSCEPLLGPVDLTFVGETDDGRMLCCLANHPCVRDCEEGHGIDWVIAGGESGHNARPSHPVWFRYLRDQCSAAGVAFHFKQWGEWAPGDIMTGPNPWPYGKGHFASWMQPSETFPNSMTGWHYTTIQNGMTCAARIGKAAAGRLLDGVEHNGVPRPQ